MSRGNEAARVLGAGLLAIGGGLATYIGYLASGGSHGWDEFTYRWRSAAFAGDALLAWLSAVALWIFCVAIHRGGPLGALGTAISFAGATAAFAGGLPNRGEPDLLLVIVGLPVWTIGVAVVAMARSAASRADAAAKTTGAEPPPPA